MIAKDILRQKNEESSIFVINELIDNAKEYFSTRKNVNVYLPIFKKALFNYVGFPNDTKSITELFSDKLSHSQQRTIACALLRLLAKDSEVGHSFA